MRLFLERLTKRREQSSGECGRRAQNRSVRVVHADSEHRPRLPGGRAVGLLAALWGWVAQYLLSRTTCG